MSGYIDFAMVKETVSIEEATRLLGLDLKKNAKGEWRGQCPTCGGDKRALCVTPAKGSFSCFTSSQWGDQIALAAHIKGFKLNVAARFLMEQYNTSTVHSSSTVPEAEEGGKETQEFQPLSYLDASHEAVEALGMDQSDAEAIGVGYAKKGLMRGFVAVPIRLPDGRLVGYIGIKEAKLPPKFHIEETNVVPLRRKSA